MTTFLQDARFALRLLIKDRGFTVTALLTLAICLAANTAMFSLVRTTLLKPLPFPQSDRFALLYNSYPKAGAPRAATAVPDYFDRQREMDALEDLAMFRREGMTYGSTDGAERLTTVRATPSFFRLLQAQPAEGRTFRDDEGEIGKDHEALISDGFRRRKFGDEASVVGRTLRLNGDTYAIVGVLPPDFTFIWDDIDLFVPAAFTPREKSDDARHSNNWTMVGRMKSGATVALVQEQVDALNRHNDERFPQLSQLLKDAGYHTVAVNLRDDLVRDVRGALYLLWGGVLFVLLIGGVNIANLAMVRANARAREMATRHAVGADMRRLVGQMFTETLLLSFAGGVLGIGVAWGALRYLKSIDIDGLPRTSEIGMDPVTVFVALMLTIVVGVILGLAPAMRLRRMNLGAELSDQGRSGTGSRRTSFALRALATTQVAIAFVLLIGAGLLFSSFRAVLTIDLGFQPAPVMTGMLNLPATSYKGGAEMATFQRRTLEAVRQLPDVEAAGLASDVPFSGNMDQSVILAEGYEMKPGESLLAPFQIEVSPGYFEAMGIPLVRGRYFSASDTGESTKVAVIDERLAERFWPGRDAVGRRLYDTDDLADPMRITPNTVFFTIVGVVKEVQFLDPRAEVTPIGAYYFPEEQSPTRTMMLVVKGRGDGVVSMSAIRQKIAAIDPDLPLYQVRPMVEMIDRALAHRRLPMKLALGFAATGLFLATVGIYGVLAYGVSQRRRELGVRMALGGSTADLFRLVMRDGAVITAVGLVVGLAGALGVGRLMESQLFGVTAMDPGVIGLTVSLLLLVALAASAIPSWRATRINPILVLSK